MKKVLNLKFFTVLFVIINTFSLNASPDNSGDAMRMQMVDMSEDLAQLTRELGQLRLEIEALSHQTRDLHSKMGQLQAARNEFETHVKSSVNESKNQVAELKKSWAETVERYKGEVLTQVTHQINKLSDRTHHAMEALARSVSRETGIPTKSASASFGEDYPKEGLVYVIQKGDTLSHIAIKHSSSVDDIQNANRIADARNLRPGQTLFIPQRKH